MKKILLSLLSIGAVAVIAVAATGAFFSDTETSEDNVIQAGGLDLKVDSEAHYNDSVCSVDANDFDGDTNTTEYLWLGGTDWPNGQPCNGTWSLTDLGPTNQFFQLTDVKPGDDGENTISLHVFDNDAWGRFVISGVEDLDNDCTDPESEVGALLDPECDANNPNLPSPSGELADSITFYAWLDQGSTPGFQCFNPITGTTGARCDADPQEGDNEQQCAQLEECEEPTLIQPGTVDLPGETHNIWEALALYRASLLTNCDATDPDGDGHALDINGKYLECHGLANDGRLVGSATYYFGLAWSVPDGIGNEAQTDSLNADLSFEIEQHRNNPTPF